MSVVQAKRSRVGNFSVPEFADGRDDIRKMVLEEEEREFRRDRNPKHQYVGAFGVLDEKGQNHIIKWRVHGHREDKRHGALSVIPTSKYRMSLQASMFKGW